MTRVRIQIETPAGLDIEIEREQRINYSTDYAATARALLADCVRRAEQALSDPKETP